MKPMESYLNTKRNFPDFTNNELCSWMHPTTIINKKKLTITKKQRLISVILNMFTCWKLKMNFKSCFCKKLAGTASNNIANPLIRTLTCAYQGVRNVSFPENFAYVLDGWPRIGSDEFLWCNLKFAGNISHLAITCSKLTMETLEQDVKYV